MSTESQSNPNQFVHPIPLNDRYERSLVGAFEHLPRYCIDNILINPDLAESKDPNLQKWFDPNSLFEKAAIFAVGRPTGHHYRLQTPTSHRAVMLQKDAYYYDEYGNGYSEISVKGIGMTNYAVREATTLDPRGFFGDYHAFQEETVTNTLARDGARVGRVIAVLPLRGDRLFDWFSQVVKRPRVYKPDEELQRVLDSNHQPALIVRLQGTDRLADGKFDNSSSFSEMKYIDRADIKVAQSHYTNNQIYGRAARLLLREMNSRGYNNFLEHYGLHTILPFREDLEWLDHVGQKSNVAEKYTPDVKALRSLYFFHDFFNARNYRIAQKVSERQFDNKLSIKNEPQDADVIGYWYDFETSLPGNQYAGNPYAMNLSFNRHPTFPYQDLSTERVAIREIATEMAE